MCLSECGGGVCLWGLGVFYVCLWATLHCRNTAPRAGITPVYLESVPLQGTYFGIIN